MFSIFMKTHLPISTSTGSGENEIFLNILRAFRLGCVPVLIPHIDSLLQPRRVGLQFSSWHSDSKRGEETYPCPNLPCLASGKPSHRVLGTPAISSHDKNQKIIVLKTHKTQGIEDQNLCSKPPWGKIEFYNIFLSRKGEEDNRKGGTLKCELKKLQLCSMSI